MSVTGVVGVTKSAGRKPKHETSRVTLPGGATAFVEESHALPLVTIVVSLRSGSAFDPEGMEGLARVVGRMLRRGCEGLLAHEIEDAVDRLGGEVSIDLSASSLSLHTQVIERNVDEFVALVARLLATPTFPQDELSRLLRETAAEIVEARDNDRSLAQHFFRRTLFAGHPYGRSGLGTVKAVETITADAVRAFYEQHFTQANVVVGFAGDVTVDRATGLATKLLAGLPKGARVEDPVPEPTMPAGRRMVIVDKPERSQTQILIGRLGTSPHDEDHVALGVANAVFGGTFTSRLMREVRSKRGWSYGAYARLSIDRRRQSFSMWTFPAATDAAACLGLELGLLETFVDKGVTPKETSFIKRYLARSQAFEVDTASKRMHQALDVELLGLPADYHSAYVERVNAVTVEEANASVKRRLGAGDLLVVVVGTAADLEPALREAFTGVAQVDVVPFDSD